MDSCHDTHIICMAHIIDWSIVDSRNILVDGPSWILIHPLGRLEQAPQRGARVAQQGLRWDLQVMCQISLDWFDGNRSNFEGQKSTMYSTTLYHYVPLCTTMYHYVPMFTVHYVHISADGSMTGWIPCNDWMLKTLSPPAAQIWLNCAYLSESNPAVWSCEWKCSPFL